MLDPPSVSLLSMVAIPLVGGGSLLVFLFGHRHLQWVCLLSDLPRYLASVGCTEVI